MQTTDILNTAEYSIGYNFCEYTLSPTDFVFIKQATTTFGRDFSMSKLYRGSVELSEVDENSCPVNYCRIEFTNIKVYKDGDVYLQMYEKHSGEMYEIQIDNEYIEENTKDIVLENPLEVIQTILAKDISDSKKIKEIKNIIQKINTF